MQQSGGERSEHCQWQITRGERVAAVDKIEEMRKPEDFIGHRNRHIAADGSTEHNYHFRLNENANESPQVHQYKSHPFRWLFYILIISDIIRSFPFFYSNRSTFTCFLKEFSI